MKIDTASRFPHPLLSKDTGDFLSGEFSINIEVEEHFRPSQVSLSCSVNLTEPTLLREIAQGRAGVGLFVTCLDGYLSRLIAVGLAGGKVPFQPGELIGKVALRPLVWAREGIPEFSLDNCHPEFGDGVIRIERGAVLAMDDEIVLNVGREKLVQMETIFSLAEAADLEGGSLALQLDSDRIKILVASDIYQQLNTLRGMALGKSIVLNSVYLPAVMQVLDTLRGGASGFEGHRWHRVFTAKCEHLGIAPDNADLWRDAQRLLQMPFSAISNATETLGEQR